MLFNSDCGQHVFYKFDAPMNEEQLCNVVNDLPGTQVDIFIPCPIFSDDQAWYPSEILEPYDGRQVPDGKYENAEFKRVAANIRSLSEQGIDSMEVWAKRRRELGLTFIPSLRMNDIHKDYVDRWPAAAEYLGAGAQTPADRRGPARLVSLQVHVHLGNELRQTGGAGAKTSHRQRALQQLRRRRHRV